MIYFTTLFIMTLRAFIGIIVAVALGVHFGLKIHDNPDYLDGLLILLWNLFKLLLLLWLIIGVAWGAIYWLWWLFENWDTIELPSWLNTIIEIFGILLVLVFVIAFIYSWWQWVHNKGGFNKWLQDRKDKKNAEKKRIANLKWEDKARYEKIKKDKKTLIIVLIILWLLMLSWMIISLFD